MSSEMEKLQTALFFDNVPDTWTKLAYPSTYSLAIWCVSLFDFYCQKCRMLCCFIFKIIMIRLIGVFLIFHWVEMRAITCQRLWNVINQVRDAVCTGNGQLSDSSVRYSDVMQRCKELDSWTQDLSLPSVVWISGLFNPQSFLTGNVTKSFTLT